MAEDDSGDFWNYRIVRHCDGDEIYFAIHECYYLADQRGFAYPTPHLMTVEPVTVTAETVDGIYDALQMMVRAYHQPVIDFDDALHAPNSWMKR